MSIIERVGSWYCNILGCYGSMQIEVKNYKGMDV